MSTTRRTRNLSATFVAIGVVLTAFQPTTALAATEQVLQPPADIGELSATLKAVITERNQQILSDPATSSSRTQLQLFSAKSKAKVAAEYDELKARKTRLAAYGQGYSSVITTFESEIFKFEAERASAEITERTDLTYTTGGPPESYRYEQIVEFTKTDSGWTIDSVKPKNEGGLPPSTVVSAAQLAPAPGARKPLILGPGQVATEAKASAPNSHVPQTKPGTGPKSDQEVTLAAGYNYTAMTNYALNWALGRNGAYRSFGNDCQNFVSQSLKTGGWADQGGWYTYDNSWWYTFANQTYSWVGAQNFRNFAVGQGRVSYLSDLNDLGPADVLQVHWPEGTPDVDHSMFVTYSPWSAGTRDIRVSYHTTDTLNRSIWNLYSSFPYATWYGLRT